MNPSSLHSFSQPPPSSPLSSGLPSFLFCSSLRHSSSLSSPSSSPSPASSSPSPALSPCPSSSSPSSSSPSSSPPPSSFPHYSPAHFKRQSPRQLQQLATNLAARGCCDVVIWSSIIQRAIEINRSGGSAEDGGRAVPPFRFFEALSFLHCVCALSLTDRELFLSFVPCFLRSTSSLEPRHLAQILTVYEAAGVRPRGLYVAVFNRVLKLAPSFYSHEFADLLCCLARLKIANPSFLAAFSQTLVSRLPEISFPDACRCVGALRSLGVAQESLFDLFDERQKKELELLPTQLLLEDFQKVLSLEFSWQAYENMIQEEFIKRTEAMLDDKDVDELADPFACLNFMKTRNLVSDKFLLALSKWCRAAVNRPATRSYKRPLAHQLVQLHDLMRERNLEQNKALEQAVLRFVADDGGCVRRPRTVKPLLYQRNRRYISCPDLLPDGVEPAGPSAALAARDPFMNQEALVRACTPEDEARQRVPFGAQAEAAYRRLQRNRKFLRFVQEEAEQMDGELRTSGGF
ncbi:hypothetical protein NCLIV_042550 [Neospora caninum Liverpool]|uniref:Uncharacterized protein n=1 Tax=Neospora caninum (strain Liverpool) TaxID=572307 RepID=F0VC54_NEOCL|nr:hypothetical protein NCLIV_042550 [Neospora caninum Liverpool]CBZ51188.1 hypothetical protein NCLIV_042550 [Neospora caninum Liverpool]CEL68499.1 TPA: hypothetical protein BN1204_042550 [Neospora caninum Liverpool]|eukprot:XP_003881221.1 hypothetical protein NCLIV_042550 [Neospora caninum Liverpool]